MGCVQECQKIISTQKCFDLYLKMTRKLHLTDKILNHWVHIQLKITCLWWHRWTLIACEILAVLCSVDKCFSITAYPQMHNFLILESQPPGDLQNVGYKVHFFHLVLYSFPCRIFSIFVMMSGILKRVGMENKKKAIKKFEQSMFAEN